MPKNRRAMATKVGLPPGTLLYTGAMRAERVSISVINYDGDAIREEINVALPELTRLAALPGVTWINVRGMDSKCVENIGQQFNIHPLVLEDILNTDQRPKLGDHEDYLCVFLRSLVLIEGADDFEGEQVCLILGENYLISFIEGLAGERDVLSGICERIRSGKGRIRRMGADYLLYSLIDSIVDHYFVVLEYLGEKIELVEDQIVIHPQPEMLHKLHALKQDMLFMRKSVWPVRELVSALERGEATHINDATLIYFRDVYDHTIQVIETVEIYRDMISGLLDIYLSSISNRMSEVMKVLTVISTIFIPLTFIAGVYGMNFDNMPELRWEYGYPIIWSVMILIAAYMLSCFKKKHWL